MGRASWLSVNNCPTRCDYIHFYYISAGNSTCFGWYPHPSPGAHSDCNYNIWHCSNLFATVRWRGGVGNSDSSTYIVASCWTIIDIFFSCFVTHTSEFVQRLKWENRDTPTHTCTHRRILVHKDAYMHTEAHRHTQNTEALEDAHMHAEAHKHKKVHKHIHRSTHAH